MRGTYQRKNPFELPKPELTAEIEFLFEKVNDWFFNTDTSNFDPDFFESLEEQWLKNGELTEKQFIGLRNIYEQWVCQ